MVDFEGQPYLFRDLLLVRGGHDLEVQLQEAAIYVALLHLCCSIQSMRIRRRAMQRAKEEEQARWKMEGKKQRILI